jgi:transposase-like protein
VRNATTVNQEHGGRRYGAELKRAVVEYAFARQGEGATIRELAGEPCLSAGLLGKWLRHARQRLEKGRVPFAPGRAISNALA